MKPSVLSYVSDRMRLVAVVFVATCVGCSQPREAASADAPRHPTFPNVVFTASPEHPTPDSFTTGQFLERDQCLVFRTANGLNFSPVLPFGSELARDERGRLIITAGGVSLPVNQVAQIKGGSGQYGIHDPFPEPCPTKQFIVGGINDLEP